MSFSYSYTGDISGMEEIMPALIAALAIPLLIGFAIGITGYVLRGIGLYTTAKRRGISHAWTAWVPVATSWLEGCISDQYRYLTKGLNKKRRTVMLVLHILSVVFTIPMIASYWMFFSAAFSAELSGNAVMSDQMALKMMSYMVVILGCFVPMMGISITYAVFHYLSAYDYYMASSPKDAVLYVVLGIFFNIVEPIFIFLCRNKDEGMPRRKEYIPNCSPELPN